MAVVAARVKLYCFVSNFIVLWLTLLFVHTRPLHQVIIFVNISFPSQAALSWDAGKVSLIASHRL
jgi:hypothetical protein